MFSYSSPGPLDSPVTRGRSAEIRESPPSKRVQREGREWVETWLIGHGGHDLPIKNGDLPMKWWYNDWEISTY